MHAAYAISLAVLLPLATPACTTTLPDCPPGTERRVKEAEVRAVFCEDSAGERHGPAISFHANGSVRARGESRHGVQEGWWRLWDEEGVLVAEIEYRGGKRVARRRVGEEASRVRHSRPGDPVHPCPDDAVVAGAAPPEGHRQWCERDRGDGAYVPHGPEMVWLSDGLPYERKEFRNGVRHGDWIKWHKGRKRQHRHYADGVPHGVWRDWHDNGVLQGETEFEHGVRRRDMSWDEQGRRRDEAVRDERGKLQTRTFWYENGNLRSQESWAADKLHGIQREWWPNGRLKREGQKRAGRDVGEWRRWNTEGQLLETIVVHPDGSRDRETLAVTHYDEPEWVPRPLPRGPARVVGEPVSCPEGSGQLRETLEIDLWKLLAAVGDSHGNDTGFNPLALIDVPVGESLACTSPDDASLKHGPAAEYDRKGRLVATGSYEDGVKEGTWIGWDAEGNRAAETEYHDGSPRRRVIWWEEGTIHSIHHYEDGREYGVFATWYRNGSRHVVGGMHRGEYHGVWMWYDETGFRYQQGEYSHGRKHGRWIDWRDDGSVERDVHYRDGQLHGPYTVMGPNDSPVERGEYQNGKKHGLWTKWRDRSKQSEAHYVEGVLEGLATTWRAGVPATRGRYERGRRVGTWTFYHPSGSRRGEGPYVWCEKPPLHSVYQLPGSGRTFEAAGHGCKQGTWTYWDEDGTVRGTFEHDELALQGQAPHPAAPKVGVMLPSSH